MFNDDEFTEDDGQRRSVMDHLTDVMPEFERRLDVDLRRAARDLTPHELRFIGETFDSRQVARIQSGNRAIALARQDEPNAFVAWLGRQEEGLEKRLEEAMMEATEAHPLGQWMLAQVGVGPRLASRLLAYVDWQNASKPTAVWRFAGLDPTITWLGTRRADAAVDDFVREHGLLPGARWTDDQIAAFARANGLSPPFIMSGLAAAVDKEPTTTNVAKAAARLPWNANLKRLCFLLGECFAKFSGNENCYYGQMYRRWRISLWEQNLKVEFADTARDAITTKRVGKSTSKFKWNSGVYSSASAAAWLAAGGGRTPPAPAAPGEGLPMLAPMHIVMRARRKAIKLFLSHGWEMQKDIDGTKPGGWKYYAISHLGHSEHIPPPPPGAEWCIKAARKSREM